MKRPLTLEFILGLALAALGIQAWAPSMGHAMACPIISTLGSGYAGAANPGDVLVSTVNSPHILRFDPVAETYSFYVTTTAGNAGGMVFDPSNPGTLRVVNVGAGTLDSYDKNGAHLGPWASGPSLNLQMGAYAPDGSLWVPDQSSNWLVHFPAGGGVGVSVTVSPAPIAPSGVVFDNFGDLYIGDAVGGSGGLTGRVLKVAAADLASVPLAATVLCDSSLALNSGRLAYDGAHTLFFGNSYSAGVANVVRVDTVTGAISIVLSSFSPLAENGGGSLYQNQSVALDLQGYLWVTLSTNPTVTGHVGLLKMDPSGAPLKFYPFPPTINGVSSSGWWAGDVAVVGADGIRHCAPTPSPTAVPWGAGQAGPRLHCGPSFMLGAIGRIGIDVRSLHGGPCGLKVLRDSGPTLAHLWSGSLPAGGILHHDWDGKADNGESLASGVYYVAFTDGDGAVSVQKVLIIR